MSEKQVKEEPKLEINDTGERILESNDPERIGVELNEAIQKADPENKPSEEEIQAALEEFEQASKDFALKRWEIGTAEELEEIKGYLDYFIKERLFWTKNGWMGVLKLKEELDEDHNIAVINKAPLKIGYQALEFLAYSLSNPGGLGYDAAYNFEKNIELFGKIFDYVAKKVEEARNLLKETQFLQDKWAAMSQGFYLEVEDEQPEPEIPQPNLEETKKEVKEETKE